jgi:hypothetical protein
MAFLVIGEFEGEVSIYPSKLIGIKKPPFREAIKTKEVGGGLVSPDRPDAMEFKLLGFLVIR